MRINFYLLYVNNLSTSLYCMCWPVQGLREDVPVLSKILAGMSACRISHVTLLSSLIIIHVTYFELKHKHSKHVYQSSTYATAII